MARDNIRETFGADYLSEESKYATELTAMQNLSDLADYLEVFADASYDTVFRQKAADLIRDMFVSDDALLSFGPLRNEKLTRVSLEKFFKKGFGKDVKSVEMTFDPIKVGVPLSKSGQEVYEGTINTTQKLTLHTLSDSSKSYESLVVIPILATQELKIFGTDTLKTWTVRFGDMRVDD